MPPEKIATVKISGDKSGALSPKISDQSCPRNTNRATRQKRLLDPPRALPDPRKTVTASGRGAPLLQGMWRTAVIPRTDRDERCPLETTGYPGPLLFSVCESLRSKAKPRGGRL